MVNVDCFYLGHKSSFWGLVGKGSIIGYITNSLGYFKMGCKNKYKPENGQGFCLSCQTNNVQIKKLIALHGCKGEEEPEASVFEASSIRGLMRDVMSSAMLGGSDRFCITYSINDGAKQYFESAYLEELLLELVLKKDYRDGTEVNELMFLVEPIFTKGVSGIDEVPILSGMSPTGKVVGVNDVDMSTYQGSIMTYYYGPYTIKEEKNTLTLYPTPGATGMDFYYEWEGSDTGSPIVINSCATVDIGPQMLS